jgi:hypothetical protein
MAFPMTAKVFFRSLLFSVSNAAALLAVGCATHNQLSRSTLNAERTLTDVRFEQVLDNIAMMCRNPETLPTAVGITTGVVQVSDNAGVQANSTWNPLGVIGVVAYFLGVDANRTVSEQWGVVALTDPGKLALMRCAYQIAIGANLHDSDECVKKFRLFLRDSDVAKAVPQGWFCVGRKKDVPLDACYCGHYRDTYAWVRADGVDALTRFFLTLLDICTTEGHFKSAQVVRTYDGGPETGKLKSTEIKTTEAFPLKDQPTPERFNKELPVLGAGLQFVPQ